jgi:hypothetical protein
VGARARAGVVYDPGREDNVPWSFREDASGDASGESGASRRADRAARGGRRVGAGWARGGRGFF